jgi:hypothetical protein
LSLLDGACMTLISELSISTVPKLLLLIVYLFPSEDMISPEITLPSFSMISR